MGVPDYVSSGARIRMAHLRLCAEAADAILSRDRITKEEEKYLKYIRTYINKWWDSLFERLETKEKERLIRIFSDNRPSLVPRISKKRKLPVSDDTVQDMLEVIIDIYCTNCTVEDNKCSKCKIFQINQDLNIVVNGEKKDGLCPFRYEKEEDA